MKVHLNRVFYNTKLTYEEFSTVVIQIESILSASFRTFILRPLRFLPITPAHFLIERSMDSIPESKYEEINANRLSTFEQFQQL